MRDWWLSLLLLGSGLMTGYVVLIGVVSVWVGLSHSELEGCWIPVVAGSLLSGTVILLFLHLLRRILSRMRQADILDL